MVKQCAKDTTEMTEREYSGSQSSSLLSEQDNPPLRHLSYIKLSQDNGGNLVI